MVCRASRPHRGPTGPGTKVGSFFFFFWWALWDPGVILPFVRLHSSRQHVTQSSVPFPPGPIVEHKGGGAQNTERLLRRHCH